MSSSLDERVNTLPPKPQPPDQPPSPGPQPPDTRPDPNLPPSPTPPDPDPGGPSPTI
jgi:hypothetical protein